MWWVETAFLCPWFGNLQLKLCVSGRSEAKETWHAQLSLMGWAVFFLLPVLRKRRKHKLFPQQRVQNLKILYLLAIKK